MTKWGWICQNSEKLVLGDHVDIGAFTYINAAFGVVIEDNAQVGSHTSIYSWSTIGNEKGRVTIKSGAKIGSHCVVMPGVTIGENSIVGALSFVDHDVPPHTIVFGIPARVRRKI